MPRLLAACDEEKAAAAAAGARRREAIGHYDQMLVLDHAGPKAQILLESRDEPVWFSSVRDAFAFTLLPEEPRDIAAIYVTDMGARGELGRPGPRHLDRGARRAVRHRQRQARRHGRRGAGALRRRRGRRGAFAAEHGGEVVAFEGVPESYVLGADRGQPAAGGRGPTAAARRVRH